MPPFELNDYQREMIDKIIGAKVLGRMYIIKGRRVMVCQCGDGSCEIHINPLKIDFASAIREKYTHCVQCGAALSHNLEERQGVGLCSRNCRKLNIAKLESYGD